MPKNEVATAPSSYSLADIERLADAVAKARMFGIATKEQAMVLMAISQAEGRHPALAARDYDIIQGQPSKKAEAMQRDFLRAGGRIEWHEVSDTKADATFSHPIGGTKRIDWDMDRVSKAGLAGKDSYKKYPRAMLRSRCISEGVKIIWPAATSGMYTPEEQADIPIRDAQPAPVSAAAELDQFAAEAPQQSLPGLPRSPIWEQESYRLEPKEITNSETGEVEPDWRKWTDDMVFLIEEASEDEIKKLRADNRDMLNRLRRDEGDLYREIVMAAEARHADLNQGAAA